MHVKHLNELVTRNETQVHISEKTKTISIYIRSYGRKVHISYN